MWSAYGEVCVVLVGLFWVMSFSKLKFACKLKTSLPQQSVQKAAKVKAVNTEKHTSKSQLKTENRYQVIIQSH